eukprot:421765-Amphidinium_carterae.1
MARRRVKPPAKVAEEMRRPTCLATSVLMNRRTVTLTRVLNLLAFGHSTVMTPTWSRASRRHFWRVWSVLLLLLLATVAVAR